MPETKNKIARIEKILECLENKYRRWTVEALVEACQEELGKSVSRRTILEDIKQLNENYSKKGGKEKLIKYCRKEETYYLTDETFNDKELTHKEKKLLKEVINIFKQLNHIPHIEDLENISLRFENILKDPVKQAYLPIQFDKLPPQKGLNWLRILYDYIMEKKVLLIDYAPFKENPKQVIIHPYLLKEYNHRWFLIGWNEEVKDIYTYALDRIKSIKTYYYSDFYMHPEFDAERYYKDIIGVTLYKEKQPEEVLLFFHHPRSKYVTTKPIHHSQKTLSQNEDGLFIQLTVIPNPELEAWILSFGNDVKVIKPATLTETIKEKLSLALKHYH